MTTTACPECGAWNAPQATRCRRCGRELRAPQIAFEGPPAGTPRPRSREEQRAEEQRKAQALAEQRAAERAQKREEERKRREYEDAKRNVKKGQDDLPRPAPAVPNRARGTLPPKPPEVAEPDATVAPAARLLRMPTHIGGLDDALGGGIPAGYIIVVGGAPGTMKSSLAFWIVASNCGAGGRRGLYVSCEETTASLLRQMEALGLDLTAARGVKILEPALLRKILAKDKSGDWLAHLQAAVDAARERDGLDFLVIDSLEALEVLAKFEDRRRDLFRLFEWLRDVGLTTFVIAERPDYVVQGNVLYGRHEEDFLADGVVVLRLHGISDQEVQRRIRIMKLRGTKHETAYLAFHVGERELQVGRVLGG